jgi:DNA processing protein
MNRGLFGKNELAARIFLNQIPNLYPSRFRRLFRRAGSARAILELATEDLMAAEVSPTLASRWRRDFDDAAIAERAQVEFDRIQRGVCQVTTDDAPDFPALLREIFDPPPVLYYKGSWPPATAAIGLVGTRLPSPYGRSVAQRLATDLCVRGITTVSGLAKGIDTAVHQATLDAGGQTVAVLGCGFDHVFPRENAELQRVIAARGTLISEFPLHAAPHWEHFPRRNRIISGLSRGVVVVEAGARSGASITARFAAEQGRDVFAVPGSIFGTTSIGCHRLIKEGAMLVASSQDILTQLGIVEAQGTPRDPLASRDDLTELERKICSLISHRQLTADDIAEATRQPYSQVASSLLSLELKQLIHSLPGQLYAKT